MVKSNKIVTNQCGIINVRRAEGEDIHKDCGSRSKQECQEVQAKNKEELSTDVRWFKEETGRHAGGSQGRQSLDNDVYLRLTSYPQEHKARGSSDGRNHPEVTSLTIGQRTGKDPVF